MSKTNDTPQALPQQPLSVLQSFTNLGMFASKDVHADTITLPNGAKAQFHVRELPDAEFRKLWGEGARQADRGNHLRRGRQTGHERDAGRPAQAAGCR